MANFLLTDAVDTAKPLFKSIWIPRQIVVDHQVRVLKVYAFASRVSGNEDAYIRV